jgi:quercetin dioxygenase-like cupin family protein
VEGSGYFRHEEEAAAMSADRTRFVSVERDVPGVEVAPGVTMRPVFGGRLNLSHVTMRPNSTAAVHTHSEEQIGYVLDGSCELTLGEETRTVRAGDVYLAPPFVPHGARTTDDGCRILDAFSPPREALRELFLEAERRRQVQS